MEVLAVLFINQKDNQTLGIVKPNYRHTFWSLEHNIYDIISRTTLWQREYITINSVVKVMTGVRR